MCVFDFNAERQSLLSHTTQDLAKARSRLKKTAAALKQGIVVLCD